MTMFQTHSRRAGTGVLEYQFQLCLQMWVVFPVTVDSPRQENAPWGLPFEYVAPVRFTAVVGAFIPPPADTRFEHDLFERRDANSVTREPPLRHLCREQLEGALLRRLDKDLFANRSR